MDLRQTLDPLRDAARRLNEAEIDRNRLIRALRSKRETLTSLAEAADISVGTVHKLTRPSTIVSVGYEGRTIDGLIDALIDAEVAVLVDVRENAISRKRGLSKRALGERLESHGISYVHEPTLGNPRDNREGFREQHPDNIAAFEAHLRREGSPALDRVDALLRDRTVGLLCFEADPCSCHRSIVAKHLQVRDSLATVRTA
jgi:uncharacterized protein (DUF488 family)